jgi:hypothetical protein
MLSSDTSINIVWPQDQLSLVAVDPFNSSDKYSVSEDLIEIMDQKNQAVKWHNIPITRETTHYYCSEGNEIRTSTHKKDETNKQSSKRVTWNENLLQIRNISPRVSKQPFKFPDQPTQSSSAFSHNSVQPTDPCSHFIYKADQPCRLKSNTESTKTTFPPCYTNTFTNGYKSATKLNCSPQLQKVVNRARAIKQLPNPTEYDWKPSRTKLTLNFQGLYDESRETMV